MLGKIQKFCNDHPKGSLYLVNKLINYFENECKRVWRYTGQIKLYEEHIYSRKEHLKNMKLELQNKKKEKQKNNWMLQYE